MGVGARCGCASEMYAQTMAPGVVRLWHQCKKGVMSPGAGGVSVPFSSSLDMGQRGDQ